MNPSLSTVTIACFLSALSIGCDGGETRRPPDTPEDSTRVGNTLVCHSGSCSSSCDDVGTSQTCNVQCDSGSMCDARCNSGQSCDFFCREGAVCRFDCTLGGCDVEGASSCSCTGDCTGSCGTSPGSDGGAADM